MRPNTVCGHVCISEKQTEGHHCDPTKIEQEIMPRTDMEGNCSTDFRI